MISIKMLQSRKGTEDGFTVKQFLAGQEYTVRDHLARAFFAADFAVPIKNKTSE